MLRYDAATDTLSRVPADADRAWWIANHSERLAAEWAAVSTRGRLYIGGPDHRTAPARGPVIPAIREAVRGVLEDGWGPVWAPYVSSIDVIPAQGRGRYRVRLWVDRCCPSEYVPHHI